MSINLDKELSKAIDYFGERYGAAETSYDRLPVSTHNKPFAQTLVDDNNKTIAVKVTETAKIAQQRYQLWHEAVHCLAPAPRMDTLWFEEGLAVYSTLNVPHMKNAYRSARIADLRAAPLWYEPWQSFKKLNPTHPKIKEIHELAPQRRFDNITAQLIVDIFGVSSALAVELCQRLPVNR